MRTTRALLPRQQPEQRPSAAMADDEFLSDVPDRPREACGVFGILAPGEDVARITYFGLYALQHRGQESAGIATADGQQLRDHRQMGLVAQAFTEADLAALPGFAAIGHTRYSTAGSSRIENAQPVRVEGTLGPLAVAHNGNLTNALTLRTQVLRCGEKLLGTSDTKLIARLLASAPGENYVAKLQYVMPQLEGAYSLVLLTPTQLIGVRDPNGVRPLSIGRLQNHWVIASETCALETVGAVPERDVAPARSCLSLGRRTRQRGRQPPVLHRAALDALGGVPLRVHLLRPPRQHHPRPVALSRAPAHGRAAGA